MGKLKRRNTTSSHYTFMVRMHFMPLFTRAGRNTFRWAANHIANLEQGRTIMRVPEILDEQHVPYELIVHAPAYTSRRRARFLHIPGKFLAKCVLLARHRGFMLAVLPATHQVDLDRLSLTLEQPVRLATAQEIADIFRDCEWGVVMPFGTLYGLPTIMDETLDPDSKIVFEAHFHAMTIRMSCRDFERVEKPQRLCFARLAG
jgi:Ala-tRNA(Pro) deacylase